MHQTRCPTAASTRKPRPGARAVRFTIIALAALFTCTLPAWAQNQPYLVKDIDETSGSDSNPRLIVELNGFAYFQAYEPSTGSELWRSDGTQDGTVLVADINEGPDSTFISVLRASGNRLFFVANNWEGGQGAELWVHDPATGETGIVVDIVEGQGSSSPDWLTDVDGTLYFTAYSEGAGVELWKSGGDAGSTEIVLDLEPGTESATPEFLTACDGELYFRAWTSSGNWALWKSDGTEGGTIPVHSGSGTVSLNPSSLTDVDGTLFFLGEDETHGNELWLHDPGTGTTGYVKDIRPGTAHSMARNLTDIRGTLYFVADDGVSGFELWTSDGTRDGTHLVEDIRPGSAGSSPSKLTAFGESVCFEATDGTSGYELWTSDGTPAPDGTRMVADLDQSSRPAQLTEVGGRLFFTAYVLPYGRELWVTDGSEANTGLVRDIKPGYVFRDYSGPDSLIDVGGTLLCAADNGTHGRELWRSDGTSRGTLQVKDINVGGGSHSNPVGLVAAGNRLFFAASHPAFPSRTLWVSDGTAFNTVMPRTASGGVFYGSGGAGVGGIFCFSGEEPGDVNGRELWRSDGTDAGTVMVEDIAPASDDSNPSRFTDLGGIVYFVANDGRLGVGSELWKSDGTEAGTGMVADLYLGSPSSLPEHLTVADGKLFFSARDEDHGRELWVHDPVSERTTLVEDIVPGSGSSLSYEWSRLVTMGDKVYFAAMASATELELWVSDGTPGGTDPVTIGPEIWQDSLVVAGNRLFFLAGDKASGPTELWVSGGTQATTVMVEEVAPDSLWDRGLPLVASGDRVCFVTDDGIHGRELWTSDGTAAGTRLVRDIVVGATGSFPKFLTPAKDIAGGMDLLFFNANDQIHGRELWVSDGTEAGTRIVHDIAEGSASSTPEHFAVMLNTLYFAADDQLHGNELWAYQFAADSDGDGLPDEWETHGYTHTNGERVELHLLGAKPDHKDVFVEVDHMAGTFDHEPAPAALAAIVAAFANAPVDNPDGETGITLHINARGATHSKPSRSVLPFDEVLGSGPDADKYDWTDFDALKAAHFSTELEWSHHYCIFAHFLPEDLIGLSRGHGASDFIVALGKFVHLYGESTWLDRQSGTFMHELGHNLGLGHGGTDNVNYKPNYLSVMNYVFLDIGLIHTESDRRWDFSREALPDLDENQLNESAGLGSSDPEIGTKYWFVPLDRWIVIPAGSALGWIDWNQSGVEESALEPSRLVPVNLNRDNQPIVVDGVISPGTEAKEPLRGASDWDRLHFEAGRIGGARVEPPQITIAEEIDHATLEAMRPEPPGKVKAHAAKRKIVLTWQPVGPSNSGILYNIYRSGGEEVGLIGNTDRSNFHDPNVTSGTTYVYSVTWVDAQGVESAPSEVTVTAK